MTQGQMVVCTWSAALWSGEDPPYPSSGSIPCAVLITPSVVHLMFDGVNCKRRFYRKHHLFESQIDWFCRQTAKTYQ